MFHPYALHIAGYDGKMIKAAQYVMGWGQMAVARR
jgi:hypothetical protein